MAKTRGPKTREVDQEEPYKQPWNQKKFPKSKED